MSKDEKNTLASGNADVGKNPHPSGRKKNISFIDFFK